MMQLQQRFGVNSRRHFRVCLNRSLQLSFRTSYNPGLKLTVHPRTIFHGSKNVHYDPLDANQSHPQN